MKESMTKFDLEAAFKALSEIEVPEAGGVKANKPALTEIFSRKSKFDTLIEEYYDISTTDGLEDAKEARDAAVAQAKLARIEKIVDLDAQSAEDLLTSYVGKYIIQCPQCLTLFYKNPEDVEASEEDPTTVNVSEVCQHCGNESGYTLVGKVGDATPEEEVEAEAEAEDLELEVEDTEEGATEETEEDSEETDEEIDLSDLDFDDEDLDLDLEDEEDNKTEEALEAANGQPLVEELETPITEDMEVSAEEFEKLINSPEFKKPISDTAVRAMLKAEAPAEEVEEDIKEEVPEDEVLEEGIFDKAKEKFAKVADAVASKLKSREDKANWILKNAVTDVNAAELVDKAGKLEPDDKDLRFKCFVVKCFKDVDKNGKAIRIAPTLKEITNLVPTEKQPGITDDFKKAEDFAKGYSGKDGNGPAFVFLAKDSKDTNAVFLCQYFEGEAKLDQLEKYFEIVKKDFASIKKMQASGLKLEDEEVEAAAAEAAEATDTEEPKTESLDNVFSELEELQEDNLESLISTSLIEAYDNVAGFRLKECSFRDNKFLLDGVIHFVSGNTRSTTYTFTEALIKDQTVTLNGVNEKLGADKQFVLTGHVNAGNKTFITEAFVANKK